jgi:hypothetical protein
MMCDCGTAGQLVVCWEAAGLGRPTSGPVKLKGVIGQRAA